MEFKKVESEEKINNKPQSVFTYSVNMIVSVFAENEEAAKSKLDSEGGHVSSRVVDLKDVQALYKESE